MILGAGISYLPEMNEEQVFEVNAGIVQNQAMLCATLCPNAIIAVSAWPTVYLLPLVSEVFKQYNVYNPDKIIGICTLSIIKANTIVGRALNLDPERIHVPIIGGNTSDTTVPLLSKAQPFAEFTQVNSGFEKIC